jgi:hypothetical protein
MGTRTPPLNLDSSTLHAALEQAFDATWTVLQARNAFRDFDRDNELQTALSQTLATLAVAAVTDPIELREWALESLPRS